MTGDRAPALCPHCGIDLRKDEPMTAGAVEIDPRSDVTVAGQLVDLTPAERIILVTLVKAAGRTVSIEAMIARTGSEGNADVMRVHIRRVREKLEIAQPGCVFIETVWALGYRWVGG